VLTQKAGRHSLAVITYDQGVYMNLLLEAVQDGEIEKVRQELEMHPQSGFMRDENGRTLLSWAAQLGHLGVVKVLIENGAEINAIDNTSLKETPLHNAVDELHPDIVEILLEHGADVSIEDNDERTALHILANIKAVGLWDEKSEMILKMLLRYGAKIETVPIATAFGTLQDIKKMVEGGADIYARLEHSERIALHIAVEENNIELLSYLIDISEDINQTDINGQTPLDIAKTKEAESILREHGGKTSDEICDEVYLGFESKDAAIRLLNEIKKPNKEAQKDSQGSRVLKNRVN
jgi:uncharacterized protein